VRYHLLRMSVRIRNIGVCLALLAASYLASGLINASPITRPQLVGPRSRGVIVAPRALPVQDQQPDATADHPLEQDVIACSDALRRL
jgi:hypothetical protein